MRIGRGKKTGEGRKRKEIIVGSFKEEK